MKLSELKLIKQWHSYVGPTDERLEKESCKIYRTGFLLLTSGCFFTSFTALRQTK